VADVQNTQFTSIPGSPALVQSHISLDRNFDILVVKQLKDNLDLAAFKLKYAEFFPPSQPGRVTLQPLISNASSLVGVNIATTFVIKDTTRSVNYLGNSKYIDVISTGILDLTKLSWVVTVKNSKIESIEDILDVRVNSTTRGASTCSFTVKNDQDKYTFQSDQLLAYRTIFEPDDLVFVRLPDLDVNLNIVFSGFINNVTKSRAAANNVIQVSCEDITKRLRYSRMAIRKGLNDRDFESQYVPLSAFTFPWPIGDAGKVASTQIFKNIGVLAYSNIDQSPELAADVASFNALYSKNNSLSLTVSSTLGVQKQVGSGDAKTATLVAALRAKIETTRGKIAGARFSFDTPTSAQVFKNEYTMVLSNRTTLYKLPVMQVEGTTQPVYQIAFVDSFNLWISEWKECHKIMQEFVNIVNYEFFCNESGTIRIRPPNMTLNHLRSDSGFADDYTLSESDIFSEDTYEDNTEITSVAVVTGDWRIRLNSSLDQLGIFGYIKDNKLIKKFGARMTNLQPVIGIVTNAGLRIWGKSMLNRINRRAFSGGSITVIGNANIRVGNYVYLEKSNALFYVETAEHTIAPGQSYKIRLGLTYRRCPYYDIAALYIQRNTTPGETFEDQRANAIKILNIDFLGLDPGFILEAYTGLRSNLVIEGYDSDEIDQIYDPDKVIRGGDFGSARYLKPFYLNGYLFEFGVEINFTNAEAEEAAQAAQLLQAETVNNATQSSSGTSGLPQGTGQMKNQKSSGVGTLN
jgi:hypothetical protein